MSIRLVKMIAPTHTVLEGGGFKVRRPSSMGQLMSPFLLLDEMGPMEYGPGEAVGAPSHPHRGFETVTYMMAGEMEHEDSAGNSGKITPGDVQWMTAGRGVVHSEMPSEKMMEQGGLMHGFQIWVNLPAKNKMMAPRYQEIASSDSPTVEKDGIWARVIAGDCLGVNSSIDTVIPITYVHVKMSQGSNLLQKINQGLNAMIYVFKGSVQIDSAKVEDGSLAILTDGDEVQLSCKDSAEFLILAGPQINEPISRYGPFVMNTRDEIIQAIDDYNSGLLG
ncbi:MAG: pirin family protein [Methanobacteriota archaeon]|jgi:redox-sensitive bicupin YhaK (pirin superfamily)|nr:MAG: pirin family protein [Euryarchaeota archaeon]HIL66111.1 pirin family protein [Candidatus Poseidoniales archaeon]